jgi:ERCC4-type nuclease
MILVASSPSDPFNQDLLPYIGGLAQPYPLQYGDINFFGVWEDSRPVQVCIERKKLSDIVQCVLNTGRHMQQVQDANEAGFEFIFIFVEGIFRPSPRTGLIEVRSGSRWIPLSRVPTKTGRMPDLEYKRLDDYLNQLDLYLGVKSRRPSNAIETARMVIDLYLMFRKPPDTHTSLRQFYTPPDSYAGFLDRPSLLRKIASQLPDVGWVRSKAFEEEFGTLDNLCRVIADGDVKALRKVGGVGKKIAETILKEAGSGS